MGLNLNIILYWENRRKTVKTRNFNPATSPSSKTLLMNCLTYLLQLWEQNHRFIILGNENHYIGVNDNKIFELGNTFKKDLQLGYSLRGGNNYIPLEIGDKERIKKIFNLDERYGKILDEYYERT